MNDPATLSPAATPLPAAARPSNRLLKVVAGPVLFFRRRPGRAILLTVTILLIIGGIAAGFTYAWFRYHLHSAASALAAGHNAAAVRHIRLCQRIYPGQREVLLLASRAARRAGSLEEADGLLGEYWHRYGDEEPLVFERLLLRATRGDLEEVGPRLQAAIAAGGPDGRLAREALVSGLTYRFLLAQARTTIDEWLSDSPNDSLAWLYRGKLYEQLQGFDDAVGSFHRAIDLDPGQLEARLRLATLLVTRRFGEEAATELVVLREELPDHPEVHILWARTLALLGRTDEARAAVDACLKAYPDYGPAIMERGVAALVEGDETAAETYLARAARMDPGNVQIRSKYALVLSRLGNTKRAAEEFARAEQLEADNKRIGQLILGPFQERPNDPALHYEIGTIALRGGLVAEALRWYASALRVNPDHLPTHRTLAVLYRELDKPALAAKHHAIAQRLSGGKKSDN